MPSSVENSLSAVAAARAAGDAQVLADQLLRHADSLLHAGRWVEASSAVDQATGLQHARGATLEEARCLRLGATLQRLQGRLDLARNHAQAALQLARSCAADPAAAMDMDVRAAHAELGEIALARSEPVAALQAFTLAVAEHADAPAAWLRGRAKAHALAGDFAQAAKDLELAARKLASLADTVNALRTTVQAASAWQQARHFDRAQQLVDAARPRALAAGDEESLAGLALLSATHALEQRNLPVARALAITARQHALASRAATPYIGAAVALSRIDEQAGDLVNAYAALATGWATIGDLLGADLARAAFEPLLRGLQARCGPTAFWQARGAYEQQRKQIG